jgi:hypothetical protein
MVKQFCATMLDGHGDFEVVALAGNDDAVRP